MTEAHKKVVDMMCSLPKIDLYLLARSVFEPDLGLHPEALTVHGSSKSHSGASRAGFVDTVWQLNEAEIAELSRDHLDDEEPSLLPRDQLKRRLEAIFGFQPKDGQLIAIETLVDERRDAIAKIGYGKSIIF